MLNKRGYSPFIVIVLLTILVLSLTGCRYPSGEKVFLQTDEPPATKETGNDAAELLAVALDTTSHAEVAQKFWYSGWVASYVQKRQINSMFNGVVIQPHGYLVNARVAANPYRYYKWDNDYYLYTDQTEWVKMDDEQVPLEPFNGLEWWQPFLDKAERLDDETVLSKNSRVYQVKVNGADWINQSDNPIFQKIKPLITETEGMDHILENTTVTMKIWIGDESYTLNELKDWAERKGVDLEDTEALDIWINKNWFLWDEENQVYKHHLIYQYETWINMPVPSGGYMDQQIFFKFYKYDDPAIKMRSPEEMEKYLLDQD